MIRCSRCQHPVACDDCPLLVALVREHWRSFRAYLGWRARPTLPERGVWCFLNDQDTYD